MHDATIRLDRNCGPATARNVALTSVTTEFVAFVDADIDVGLDITWLTALLSHFDDPEVVAVAPRVRSRPQRGVIGYHEHHNGALDLGPRPAVVRPGTRVSYVPAAALICRAEAVRAIGGFDEDLRTGKTSTSCGGSTMQDGRFDTTPLLRFNTNRERRLENGGTNAPGTAIRRQPLLSVTVMSNSHHSSPLRGALL